ncbi:MAG: FtsX-like permease family protein [Longimicrobiales bacterium]
MIRFSRRRVYSARSASVGSTRSARRVGTMQASRHTPIMMTSRYDSDPVELRLMLLMVGIATLSVLLLSAAGISAMMSFAVTQRRREIGIRTALGASRRQLVASIFSRSTKQLGIGLLIGGAGTALVDRLADGDMLRGEVIPLLAFVATIMILSGLLAALGPALRALRIQPMEALREE